MHMRLTNGQADAAARLCVTRSVCHADQYVLNIEIINRMTESIQTALKVAFLLLS